jgi:hypothetical protein
MRTKLLLGEATPHKRVLRIKPPQFVIVVVVFDKADIPGLHLGVFLDLRQNVLSNAARIQDEPPARPEDTIDRLEKPGISVIFKVTKAVTKAKSAVERTLSGEIAHIGPVPGHHQSSSGCQGPGFIQKLRREIHARDSESTRRQLDGKPAGTTGHVKDSGRWSQLEHLLDEIRLHPCLIVRDRQPPHIH